MRTITQKTRHKNTPTKRLISIILARYIAASAKERLAILQFFNWTIRNCFDRQLQEFYIEVKTKVLEVAK